MITVDLGTETIEVYDDLSEIDLLIATGEYFSDKDLNKQKPDYWIRCIQSIDEKTISLEIKSAAIRKWRLYFYGKDFL